MTPLQAVADSRSPFPWPLRVPRRCPAGGAPGRADRLLDRDRAVVDRVERHLARTPSRRAAHRAPEALQRHPVQADQAVIVVRIHHRITHAGGPRRFTVQGGAEQHVPHRQHLAIVAVVQAGALRVDQHVVQAVEFRRDEDAVERAAEAQPHIGVRGVLHQFAEQHQPGELVRVHADHQAHRGQDHRLDEAVDEAAAVVGPAIHLARAVVHAVQRPPPRDRVLGAVHPVVHEVVDHVVRREQHVRMVVEPRHQRLQRQRRDAARGGGVGAAEQVAERHQHQVGEQREDAQQHQQRVVAVDQGELAIGPLLRREESLQRAEHEADDGDLQRRDQQRGGDVARITGELAQVQQVERGSHRVAAQPVDQIGPELGKREHRRAHGGQQRHDIAATSPAR
ncbi:hypothetical protein RLIN73S_07181 [Rhodanobacter lindaniclasticus]